MTNPKIAPYGSWKSPITSDLIVAGSIGLGSIRLDGEDIYWLEGRPTEGGRSVLVKLSPDGTRTDITPQPYNVRTRVHEYGGGSYLVVDGRIYFSNFADQQLYKQLPNSEPQRLTPESKQRYADIILDQRHNRLICVCEDQTNPDQEPENSIVSVDLNNGEVKTLVSGCDFYSSPRLSPDGLKLAWISWNHPNLPWDQSQISIASVKDDGTLGDPQLVAGEENESICEPKWSAEGYLYFASDRSGWWNLYRYSNTGVPEPLYPMKAEFSYPHWVFGLSTYTFSSQDNLLCSYTQNGRWYLANLNLTTQQFNLIDIPYTDISALHATENYLLFVGGSPTQPGAIVKLDLSTQKTTILKQSTNLEIDSGYISIPQAIAFPTTDGLTAYGWYYPPTNQDYQAPDGELPPLLVKSHGGPTACASASLSLRVQYWTSRGFAYLDVNYGGSTGFGREYRQRLEKKWGIVDVDDCVNGAKYLVDQGKVDGDRLAISGGSAGGYTTLAALTFRDTFKAGASYYGVSDLEALARDTHKFESRYLDRLIGKYPEEKELYQQRSPIMFTDRLSCPVIFFQGLEDKVVPPNQTELMVEAIKNKGLPVAYVPFEGEQHGFRRAENIKRALDGEFYFYSRIFGFTPAEDIQPVEIENL
ncbi:peptidase S9 prolyl oligopeptidase active site domain protein [Gloeothece citriformis PCC 7424]|uniref:Peptidase S9 prolyl oligopeptidase active site domain protein n=1 Tax=Gloeothece citriformis (strain PCC 7424) TaxID=65393 RepID=B7K7L2_GLOC7|nr:S9 family peptidase [Gloeothece citriformis]ACK69780.1 peptidase S9 prolyl oligopeptidase active site domain protein [Gloeothece citriformis PCC 7424]